MNIPVIYLIIWVVVFGGIFGFLVKKGWLGDFKFGTAKTKLDKDLIRRRWREINDLMNQGKPSTYKVAVMDADKLVDYVLKAKVGSAGTMADRLKKSKGLFRSYYDYQNLWEAHKMRNRMVHDAEHEIYPAEVKKVISYFEKALKELQAL